MNPLYMALVGVGGAFGIYVITLLCCAIKRLRQKDKPKNHEEETGDDSTLELKETVKLKNFEEVVDDSKEDSRLMLKRATNLQNDVARKENENESTFILIELTKNEVRVKEFYHQKMNEKLICSIEEILEKKDEVKSESNHHEKQSNQA